MHSLAYLASHPVYALRRLAYRAYELTHRGEPWLAQGAIKFCDRRLDRRMVAVETGSGRSSAWFAKRVGRLTSVEHDAGWYERVGVALRQLPNVDYRLIALDHPAEEPTRPVYDRVPRYVAVFDEFADGGLDFVIVDGHYRQACVRAAVPKLKVGGLLLIDNSNWLSDAEWGVPPSWRLVHRSSNVMTTTSLWEKT